jgi:hypothetical protein
MRLSQSKDSFTSFCFVGVVVEMNSDLLNIDSSGTLF